MTTKEAKELAESHWDWLEPILRLCGQTNLGLMKYLFITAMIHGIKHESVASGGKG